jgi:2-aminophenol/2-amino-5-chlorophenol 1,6-dioxygenase alpha subunit
MPVVSAFLVPGCPLPQLKSENLPWGRIGSAYQRASRALAASRPEVVVVYSTQWMAVLDQQWLARRRSQGVLVDENWHEYGELPFDIMADTELAYACAAASPRIGVHARGINYDGFPIDSGTIVACTQMGMGTEALPVVVASNNLYHSAEQTEKLGALAVQCALEKVKRVAVVGVGGLSNAMFREQIDIRNDHLSSRADDQWNQRVLRLIESADVGQLRSVLPEYVSQAKPEMGFKHLHWIVGGLGGRYASARVHGYGPLYGSGGAVVEFVP